jgi:hypothetical protein
MEQIENKGKQPATRYDNVKLGAALGMLAPLFTFLVYYLIFHSSMTLDNFLDYLKTGQIFVSTLSLCVISNLLLFFIFIWTNKDKSARGVVMATFIYAIYVAIMKTIG